MLEQTVCKALPAPTLSPSTSVGVGPCQAVRSDGQAGVRGHRSPGGDTAVLLPEAESPPVPTKRAGKPTSSSSLSRGEFV